jgi:hypothetical protein
MTLSDTTVAVAGAADHQRRSCGNSTVGSPLITGCCKTVRPDRQAKRGRGVSTRNTSCRAFGRSKVRGTRNLFRAPMRRGRPHSARPPEHQAGNPRSRGSGLMAVGGSRAGGAPAAAGSPGITPQGRIPPLLRLIRWTISRLLGLWPGQRRPETAAQVLNSTEGLGVRPSRSRCGRSYARRRARLHRVGGAPLHASDRGSSGPFLTSGGRLCPRQGMIPAFCPEL